MRIASVGVVSLLLVCLLGCSGGGESLFNTPEGRKTLIKEAGEVVTLTYLATANPSEEEALTVKATVAHIAKLLTEYRVGGFVTALPEIDKLIEDNLAGDKNLFLRAICKKAANILVNELDKVFERHPDWKALGAEVAGLTAAFFEGASSGFTKYRQQPAV